MGRLRRASDDRRQDTVALLVTAGLVLASYGLGSAVQTVYVFRLVAQVAIEDAGAPIAGVAPRILVNGLTTLTLLALLVLLRAPAARGWRRAAVVVGVAPAAAAARVVYQELFGVYAAHTQETARVESVERRMLALRVAEEALTNAIKHGHADHVSVRVSRADDDAPGLRITVEDDGQGMAEDAALSGLARLQERLGAVGGRLDVIPQPRGTRVDAIVPAASPGEQGAGT